MKIIPVELTQLIHKREEIEYIIDTVGNILYDEGYQGGGITDCPRSNWYQMREEGISSIGSNAWSYLRHPNVVMEILEHGWYGDRGGIDLLSRKIELFYNYILDEMEEYVKEKYITQEQYNEVISVIALNQL